MKNNFQKTIAKTIFSMFIIIAIISSGVTIATSINQNAEREARFAKERASFNTVVILCVFQQLTELRVNTQYYAKHLFENHEIEFQPNYPAPTLVPKELDTSCKQLTEILGVDVIPRNGHVN